MYSNSTSMGDRKLILLETMVSNQKQMIDLLSSLNNNIQELLVDMKEIKASSSQVLTSNGSNDSNIPQYDPYEVSATSVLTNSSSNTSMSQMMHSRDAFDDEDEIDCVDVEDEHEQAVVANEIRTQQDTSNLLQKLTNSLNRGNFDQSTQPFPVSRVNNENSFATVDHSCDDNYKTAEIGNFFNTASSLMIRSRIQSNLQQGLVNELLTFNNIHNRINQEICINSKINGANNSPDSKSSLKQTQQKVCLREFSTYVSKAVRQEFGQNYLIMNRINELDRHTMQRIREEATSRYLPAGVAPQKAWNHAMNSLRQLRHRVCKKAKGVEVAELHD